MKSPAQRGFTLVELVVVILVVGILAAVAIPRLINAGADAERTAIDAWVGALRTARVEARLAGSLYGGYPDASYFDSYVQCDGTPIRAPWPDSAVGAYIGMQDIRPAVFRDPDEMACIAPTQIQFTSKTGRRITITQSGPNIGWSATPAY